MKIIIKELRKKDQKKAIQFAIIGMHFDWYLDNTFLLNLYGRYFWYMEMNRATQVIAAYIEDEFAGILLAEMKGEKKKYRSFGKSLYVKVFDFIATVFFKEGVGGYDQANKEMFSQYSSDKSPDGEIVFLASNPEIKVKGIGSQLLHEFERQQVGKEIFLYTDNACTYEFYEHRGFVRSYEKEIELEIVDKKIPLQCFLYSKQIKS